MTTDTIATNAPSGVVLDNGSYSSSVTIASGITVGDGTGTAVTAGSSWTLDNQGTVVGGPVGVGLYQGGALTNEAGGTITAGYGSYGAVYISGTNPVFVQNAGLIEDDTGSGLIINSLQTKLVNTGTIIGKYYGVSAGGDDITVT
ncbi:MAG TPA: hypothetical protein VH722_06215, partial [Alphaproteobacteria bacterium]|nr:hypothetical protein [Alphaproteobacteria bacterium]